MEQKGIRLGFGFVLGPIILYWVIQFFAMTLGESVVIFQYIMQHPSAMETAETMKEFMTSHMTEIYAVVASRAVELNAVGAIATLFLTVTLYVLDVRKAKQAGWVSTVAKPSVLHYVLIVVFSVAVCIALNNLANMADLAFYSDSYQEISEVFYSASYGVQLLCLGIIVPVAEEFLFRGIIFRRYRLVGGLAPALVWSTLLFSASHGNIVQMLYAGVLGVFFGYVYEKFGTILAPISMHVLVNLTSLIVTHYNGFSWMFGGFERLAIVTIGCSFVTASVFVLFQKMESRFPAPVFVKKKPTEPGTPDEF